MNPLRLWKLYRKASRLFGYMQEASVSKNLLKSKTFYFNVLTAVAELIGVIPLPPGTALIAVTAINVALRVITKGPVHVLTNAAKEDG